MTTLGLSASRKSPGVFLAVILGGAGTSAGVAPKRILLMGNKITSALTGASPALSVSAGTMADATPTFCAGADDAGTYTGRGSELHVMAAAVFAQYPSASVTLVSVAESAGTKASLILTFATTASAAYTVRVYACGQILDVAVDSGATATVIASNVADAINDADVLPYTAQNSAGELTLTAKNFGPRGNTLTAAFSFISAAGAETRITTGSTTSSGATTGILSGGAQVEGEYLFSLGATQDTFAAAIASVASSKFDRIVAVCLDATNIGLLSAHLDSLAGVTSQMRQQGIVPCLGTLATAVTLTSGANRSRLQLAWHFNSRIPAGAVAAQVTAARLIGDSAAGGILSGEENSPSANLDGLELVGITAQNTIADRPTATEIESALNNGITPLVPSANRPGFVTIARSITTRSLSAGVPNYAVLDTSNVTVCDAVADGLGATLATTYAGFRLAPDSADGLPPRAPLVTTPSLIRAVIARELALYEEAAWIINTAANLTLLTVIASLVTPGRVDCDIPCEPMPGLHVLGGNVRQLS